MVENVGAPKALFCNYYDQQAFSYPLYLRSTVEGDAGTSPPATMWSKLASALKPRQTQPTQPVPAAQEGDSQGDAVNKALEDDSNLAILHPGEVPSQTNQERPPLPDPTTKLNVFKRLSRHGFSDNDNSKPASSLRVQGLKKMKTQPNFNTVSSKLCSSYVSPSSEERGSGSQVSPDAPADSRGLTRSSSVNVLSSPQEANQPPSRSSVDVLRNEQPHRPSGESERPNVTIDTQTTPGYNDRMASVRSILREPNTPGTGQNVRFFSRDAFKVISPEHSMEADDRKRASTPSSANDSSNAFMDELLNASPESMSTPAVRHTKPSAKTSRPSRPTVSEIFSPLHEDKFIPSTPVRDPSSSDMSFSSPAGNTSSNIFDVSHPLDLPFNPPGLGFDVDAPVYDQSLDLDSSFNQSADSKDSPPYTKPVRYTSTPLPQPREGQSESSRGSKASLPPVIEEVFHSLDVPQRIPTPLHERTQSSLGSNAVFYSPEGRSEASGAHPSNRLSIDTPSSEKSSSSSKSRARAISDSMLQNMLRGSTKSSPEADAYGERATSPAPQPDPFSAHASTYYTPQVNIPTTPPKSAHHASQTSKEETLIYSLQAQLTLQTELCQQYEADLRARDELVEILGKKLADAGKQEAQRQASVRQWKRRVTELQKLCRHLEEEVDDSRQASMERSIMDEASGEALRMLHRQIAALERDKAEQEKREHRMREEIETLEVLVNEKSEDVVELKQMLWSRDESEKEIDKGIRDVKAQVDDMGNVASAYTDETVLKRFKDEKEHAVEEERARHRGVEAAWHQEKEDLIIQFEGLQTEMARCDEDLEQARHQLKVRDEEYETLRNELEAQWTHTEDMTSKIKELEKAKLEAERERDDLRHHVEDLEARINSMELEWNESENKRNALEAEVQELWHVREALEKDRDEVRIAQVSFVCNLPY